MALTDVPDEAYPLPERGDQVDGWHRRHERAALLRAQDWSWQRVADEIGVSEVTARRYTTIDGFKNVVAHFEVLVRRKRVEESDLKTLEVILEYKHQVLEALAKKAIDLENSEKANAEFLEAIGFTARNEAAAMLMAEEKSGESGDDDGGDIIVDTSIEGVDE